MESAGINPDQNFYSNSRLFNSSAPSSSPERTHRDHAHEPPDAARSPQVPPKLPFLTTQNLQAATANGFIGGLRSVNADPDEFYRDYRGVQQSSHGYNEVIANGMPAATDTRPGPSSLRSNGNGFTPKHPAIPSYRSASSPIDSRGALGNAKSTPVLHGAFNARQPQPSVKDLLKRFDQNNELPSAVTRKPAPRIVTSQGGYQARLASTSPNPTPRATSTTRETGPTRVKSPIAGKTQRTRFAAEDQHSNNTLSSIARVPRPRNVVPGTNAQASRSMTNLSPTSANRPSQAPTQTLFGEVNASKQDFEIGHGIPRTVGRRTSESSLHPPNWLQERTRLTEIDASSPTTGWYRGATTLDDAASRMPRTSPGHNRNHSDMPDHRVNKQNGIHPTFSTTAPTPTTTNESFSRIPIATQRYSGSSQSSSVASSRSNSRGPSPAARRHSHSHSRLNRPEARPWSPPGRPSASANRSRTPTRPRGSARNPEVVPANNTSLKAYISAPLPKLSPPLRSSRPRQPVSSATTASSRQRATERSGSPQQVRTGIKVTRTNATDRPKPKKTPSRVIDTGPVDFEAHRAKIKRAYTKSLHESEQAEIRLANMRRLQEREQENAAAKSAAAAKVLHDSLSNPEVHPEDGQSAPTPLHIDTNFAIPQLAPSELPPQPQDSPTLGTIPGAFVEDEAPASAVSNSTEIENEPQTEAPRLSRMVSSQTVAPIMVANQTSFGDELFSPEQAIHGMSHNDDEIQIMLDAPRANVSHAEMTTTSHEITRGNDGLSSPTRDDTQFSRFEEDPVHKALGLTMNQHDVSPILSRPDSPLEYGNMVPPHFSSHYNMTRQSASYADDLISPTNVRDVDGTRLELPSINATLAPPPMNDLVQESLHTPVTDFDYESSDGMGFSREHHRFGNDGFQSSGDLQLPDGNVRASRLSGWTDYSISTTDEYSGQDLHLPTSPSFGSLDRELERRPTPPPKENRIDASPSVPPKPDGYSPVPSPRFPLDGSRNPSASHSEVSATAGGSFNSLDEKRLPGIVSVTPLWPGESSTVPSSSPSRDISPAPPTRPPPPPGALSDRSHSFLSPSTEDQNAGSSLDIPSDDAKSLENSPSLQGSVQESVTVQTSQSDASSEAKVAVPTSSPTEVKEAVVETEDMLKNKKRLFQRRMLIKELIDTEAVYLKDMNVVEEIYKGTAEACPKLDANDINTIFRNTAKLVAFSTKFLEELKSAGSSVYSSRSKGRPGKTWTVENPSDRLSMAATLVEETDEQKDRKTFVGANFGKHLKEMQDIYTDFLKNSEAASARLQILQTDSAVKVWLGECNLVAKDLTQAWDLDALLVKPVQRITRYQLLLAQIFEHTPEDHPDYNALQVTCRELAGLLKNIDDLKRRIQVVGKIVGRKRKESDVRTGLAKAFGRREKPQANTNRPADDEVYVKLHEKFGDDYLRLQVVLRDVEFYTRQCTTYVNDFLRYLSSMELIMRMSASNYPELESKWARFNMSMRDMGTIALEDHITSIRTKVIEPFEHVIRLYGPPGLAMKKRTKRRLDYERSLTTKSKDSKLTELVDQYEALNETLKLELPKLSALTEEIGRISLIQFVRIQTQWYEIWKEKVKVVLEESQIPKDIEGIVDMFHRDIKYPEARAWELSIVNGTFDNVAKPRISQSTQGDDSSSRSKPRPSNLSSRSRGLSITSDQSPSLPTPDFAKRLSGSFTFSPIAVSSPGLPQVPAGPLYAQSRVNPVSPGVADTPSSARPYSSDPRRPSTSRSYTSDNGVPRLSTDYNPPSRRQSGANYYSSYHVDGPPSATRPYSGLFNSALPDGPEESQRSSRASSRDRGGNNQFNPRVLYLAASLFEFNISATKSEAGYPYLTYQAGEIFDVLAEKGELWLAKNQDDPNNVVGWIWSKHFARLATD